MLAGTEIAARSNVRFSALTTMVMGSSAWGVGAGLVGSGDCVAVPGTVGVDVGGTSVGVAVAGRRVMLGRTVDGSTELGVDETAVAPRVDDAVS